MAKDVEAPLETCDYSDCESTDFTSGGWDGETNIVTCGNGHTLNVSHADE